MRLNITLSIRLKAEGTKVKQVDTSPYLKTAISTEDLT